MKRSRRSKRSLNSPANSMKKLLLLSTFVFASCGMEVTYTHPKTGIIVTEVIDGKFKPVLDLSKLKFPKTDKLKDQGFTITPTK